MTDIVDVQGLAEEDVKFIERLVSLLRTKPKTDFACEQRPERKLDCAVWPAKITGRLTREELYEDR